MIVLCRVLLDAGWLRALLYLLRGTGDFGKIWSACGQHEIQYTEWTMNKYDLINYMHKLNCVFSIHYVQQKYN
jgi:hypothetical protein